MPRQGVNHNQFLLGIGSGLVVMGSVAAYYKIVSRIRNKEKDEASVPKHSSKQDIEQYDGLPKIEEPTTIPLPRQSELQVIPAFSLMSERDTLYQDRGPKPFQFNNEVVQVFDDMISRSVPLYREAMVTLLHWVSHYYQPGTQIYDLGCSTGTTLDFIARSFHSGHPRPQFSFVGVDNSLPMIEKANEKLVWIDQKSFKVQLIHGDLMTTVIDDCSIVIMNYTLQFIPVHKRLALLTNIFNGLCDNGILYLSEKVRSSSSEFQETCTHIYEDFKYQRGYTQTEIARKKEALMNVLVPYTEEELRELLKEAGFHHAQVVVKWNNFSTVVALKRPSRKDSCGDSIVSSASKVASPPPPPNMKYMEALFEARPPMYLNLIQAASEEKRQQSIHDLLVYRENFFRKDLKRASKNLGEVAKSLSELPVIKSVFSIQNDSVLQIGKECDLDSTSLAKLQECLNMMKPWKKGPLNMFGTHIETEWRSDWKWKRLVEHIDPLNGHVVCDLGCANGYFMYRMLDAFEPALVVGIDPNYKAWLEFQCFQTFCRSDKLVFELMDGDCMDQLVGMFDTVFCLGVLYHTPDPIGMLRKIHVSMKPGAQLVIDCQGIPGEDPVALFPKGRYTNAKGFWFLPTVTTLKNWLTRTNFGRIEIFYSEPLSTEEQRANSEWADMKSLNEGLDPNDPTKTTEGYPAPHRFYLKCYRN